MSAVRADRNPPRPLTDQERRRAGIWCASHALRTDDPTTVTRELLWATGLLPGPDAKGDSHAYRKHRKNGAGT